jgi:hypothetical protein
MNLLKRNKILLLAFTLSALLMAGCAGSKCDCPSFHGKKAELRVSGLA